MSDIHKGNMRLISQVLLDELNKAFPAPDISHDTPNELIKWQAAQHAVVRWIEDAVNKHQTVLTQTNRDLPAGRTTPTGAIVKLGVDT